MTNDWERWGLEPFARCAPPWSHVLGPRRLVVARFELDSSDWRALNEDWRLDRATTLSDEHPLRSGDLVTWVGAYENGGPRHVWAPALVVEASTSRHGRQQVSAVAFDRHEAIGDEDVVGWIDGLLLERAGVVSGLGRRALLSLWGLDVMCPRCGAVGAPITWGIAPPDDIGRGLPTSAEDAGGETWLGGCVVGSEQYACRRCGQRWPHHGDGRDRFDAAVMPGVAPWRAHTRDADLQER